MTHKSPEEVALEYSKLFGEKDGAIVHRLTDTVTQLYYEWRLFLYFFCGPIERVNALNKASGITSKVLQRLLWDNAVLKVRALTDPMGNGSNQNLSLGHLVRISEQFGINSLRPALSETEAKTNRCRKYATKYLAHKGYHHAVGSKVTGLTRGETTAAIEAIRDFIRKFHGEVRDVDYFLTPIMDAGNEERFLAFLHYGAIHNENLRSQEEEDIRDCAEFCALAPFVTPWESGLRT